MVFGEQEDLEINQMIIIISISRSFKDDLEGLSNHERPSYGQGMGAEFSGMLGHTSTLEHLQSNLKQRDGEVYQLHWELNRMQSQRNTLSTEVSDLMNQIETVRNFLYNSYNSQLFCI